MEMGFFPHFFPLSFIEGTECTKGSSQTGRERLKLNDMVYDCNVAACETRKRETFFFVFVVAKASVWCCWSKTK